MEWVINFFAHACKILAITDENALQPMSWLLISFQSLMVDNTIGPKFVGYFTSYGILRYFNNVHGYDDAVYAHNNAQNKSSEM